MASETTTTTTPRLPKIDLSGADMQPGTESWVQVRAQVQHALESYGCFEAVYTKFPLELQAAVFRAADELFALPVETKRRYSRRNRSQSQGYMGQVPHLPLYEGMNIDDPTLPQGLQSFTDLIWQQGNQSFSEAMLSFCKNASELDQMVKRMIMESLGVDKYYDSHIKSGGYLLRIMKYTAPDTREAQIGLGDHTDANFVTILCANGDGLEVRTKDGEWFPVEASPGSFVVVAGNSLLAWTNGRVHSANHRITMREGSEDRYSVGLFSVPGAGHTVQAPEELVDEDHPLLFNPFDFHEFLEVYRAKKFFNEELTLKDYCGA